MGMGGLSNNWLVVITGSCKIKGLFVLGNQRLVFPLFLLFYFLYTFSQGFSTGLPG
jgi:hypothetical protein